MTGTSASWCERLYDEHAAAFILYGRALGLSHSEAEDVLQDTFLSLLKLVEPPREPAHFAARCFRNRALNFRRSLWRRVVRELESWHWFEPGAEEHPAERVAMGALAGLPAPQREVIVLKIWHQMTFEAIAELLGLSPNTVAARYRYGLQKLRTLLSTPAYERLESTREPNAFMETPWPVAEA